MPIYAYRCEKCDHAFDHLAKSMAARTEQVNCPKCGSTKTARQLAAFAVSSSQPGAAATAPEGGMCGCGRVRGSCGNN